MSETAERLMDLAEAHIRTPDMGASASATLRPRSASRARACLPTKATMTAAVARRYGDRFLAESLDARMRAPEMPSPFTDWPSGRLSVARGGRPELALKR